MLKLYYLYKRANWYLGVFLSEINEPLTIVKYTSYAAIVFKFFGVEVSLFILVLAFPLTVILGVLIGIFIIKTGAVKVVQSLGNSQNPELLEILERIKQLQGQRSQIHDDTTTHQESVGDKCIPNQPK